MSNKVTRHGKEVWIELNDGLITRMDEADYWKVSGYQWKAFKTGRSREKQWYVHAWYRKPDGRATTTYLHRLIMDAPKGTTVDHINGDTLDNRRTNLRIVSNAENNANRQGAYSASKTGVRGVSTHQCWSVVKGQRAKSGLMYVFRCHIQTCKAAKYFPHTDEGLETAKQFAEAHFAALDIVN
ncbi:MAG: HNH endonuclease signature motif containing protein [Ktedonobacterales bacterium]